MGLLLGSYVYFEAGTDPTAQANAYITAVTAAGGLRSHNFVPIVDVESMNGQSAAVVLDHLHTYVNALRDHYGVAPIISTYATFWDNSLGGDTSFASAGNRLWIWSFAATPPVPANNWGGRGWSIWAYTDSGTVPGVGGVDLDVVADWSGLLMP
jgi:lysozyme